MFNPNCNSREHLTQLTISLFLILSSPGFYYTNCLAFPPTLSLCHHCWFYLFFLTSLLEWSLLDYFSISSCSFADLIQSSNVIYMWMVTKFVSRSELCPKPQTHVCNCLLDFSVWLSHRQLKFSMFRTKFPLSLQYLKLSQTFPFQFMVTSSFYLLRPKIMKSYLITL